MLQNLNELMDYIEEHLLTEVNIREMARAVGISEYHLKRTFSFLAGMSLTDYIKRRRLACANQDLLHGEKVTDLAFKYGYHSVEGFSRAFREFSGYLPSETIKNRQQTVFPRLTFYIDVRGGVSMDVKIEQKAAFHLVGVTKEVPIQFEGENQAIRELAAAITDEQRAEMHRLADLDPYQVLNASYDFDEDRMSEKGSLMHLIGVATTKDNCCEGLVQVAVASHTWAVFPNKGPFPQILQETWGRIYSEWLPTVPYELAPAPEISFTRFDGDQEERYSEIWIAIKEKD